MLVALDGPAAAGKSSTAGAVASRTSLLHVDTGLIYRVLAYEAQAHAVDGLENLHYFTVDDIRSLNIHWKQDNYEFLPQLDDPQWPVLIRIPEIGLGAAALAQNQTVRAWVMETVDALRHNDNLLVSGRDVGTVMFPNADLKIFLTADPSVRALRRLRQRGISNPRLQLLEAETRALEERDHKDRERAIAPLRCAEDALVVDTSNSMFEDQVQYIVDQILHLRCVADSNRMGALQI